MEGCTRFRARCSEANRQRRGLRNPIPRTEHQARPVRNALLDPSDRSKATRRANSIVASIRARAGAYYAHPRVSEQPISAGGPVARICALRGPTLVRTKTGG